MDNREKMEQNGEFQAYFKEFLAETSFTRTIQLYEACWKLLGLTQTDDNRTVYNAFRNATKNVTDLWEFLDKVVANDVYGNGDICKNKQVVIVGAGPCGLRMAIECALLGAKTVVLEARNYISRNNVLQLWPFVINDVKRLGGKVLFRQFCTGGIDHISIKRLQYVLAKIAMLFGVRIVTPVEFEGLVQPDPQTGAGWRVKVTPADHDVTQLDVDVIVGANGKSRSLPDFRRTLMRGKFAIAITANFRNRRTTEEVRVRESGARNYLNDRQFFLRIHDEIDVDLENIVYFKDETHYFVMTVKKESLLKHGVLKQDYRTSRELLARDNRNQQQLVDLAKKVANSAVEGRLPNLEYALNHHDQEDVAMFDFTALSVADYSCFAKERHERVLLQCIVGDSAIEPFWPSGSGAGKGFLSVLDAAWLVRGWFLQQKTKLELLAEREMLFQHLVQHVFVAKGYESQTMDPTTRYVGITRAYAKLVPTKVANLYNTHDDQPLYKGSQHSHMPLAKPTKTSSQKAVQRDVTIQDDMAPAMLRSKSGYYMDLMEKHKSAPDLKEKHKSAPDLSQMPRLDYLKAKSDSSSGEEDDYVPAGISKRLIEKFETKSAVASTQSDSKLLASAHVGSEVNANVPEVADSVLEMATSISELTTTSNTTHNTVATSPLVCANSESVSPCTKPSQQSKREHVDDTSSEVTRLVPSVVALSTDSDVISNSRNDVIPDCRTDIACTHSNSRRTVTEEAQPSPATTKETNIATTEPCINAYQSLSASVPPASFTSSYRLSASTTNDTSGYDVTLGMSQSAGDQKQSHDNAPSPNDVQQQAVFADNNANDVKSTLKQHISDLQRRLNTLSTKIDSMDLSQDILTDLNSLEDETQTLEQTLLDLDQLNVDQSSADQLTISKA